MTAFLLRADLRTLERIAAQREVPIGQAAREMLERVGRGVSALAVELAPLARRDPDAFALEWSARVERLSAEVLEQSLAEIRQWSAKEKQWRTPQ